VTALSALTERMVLATLRNDLPFAIVTPIAIFLFFNLSLGKVIDTGAMSYPQYILPVIIVQVIFLGGLTTVDRAAGDVLTDFGVRLKTLPINTVVPLAARMLYCLIRGTVALLAAFAIAYPFGFRMEGGLACGVAFTLLVLAFTLAISLAADVAGILSAQEPGRTQLFLVPQMLLIMLSSGMAPVASFPHWLHPFVRYQPVSQVTETLRRFSTGHVIAGNLVTSLAWCLGLLALFGAIAVRLQRRTQ
jgi:ABC-2 type transport system permease protein